MIDAGRRRAGRAHLAPSRPARCWAGRGPPTTGASGPPTAPAAAPRPTPPNALPEPSASAVLADAEQRPVRRQVGRRRCGRRCSTRASTCARCRRCTGSCASRGRPANAAARPPTRPGSSPSWWPPARAGVVAGTSPSSAARPAGVYYDLYVIIDIFSRYVVGWTVAARETAELAEQLHRRRHRRARPAPAAVHADRGTSMTSKPVAQLLVDLGVARSHSRPHVSNDNPYSEAAFKTLKYCPGLPRPVRLAGRRPRLLRAVLRLLQPRAPPLRHRAAHPGLGPLRHRRPRSAPSGPRTLAAAYAANPDRFRHRRPAATEAARPPPGSTNPAGRPSYRPN